MIHTPTAATGTRRPARDPRLRHWRLRARRGFVIVRAAPSGAVAMPSFRRRGGTTSRGLSGTLPGRRVAVDEALHALDDLGPLPVELQEVLVERLFLALRSGGKTRSASESTSERPTSHQGVVLLTSSRFWHLWSSRSRWLLQ
jgi:hypothetical protein